MAKILIKLTKDELDILRTYRIFSPQDKQIILDYFRTYYEQEKRNRTRSNKA